MKRNISIALFFFFFSCSCIAQEKKEMTENDSTFIPSLDEIIKAESSHSSKKQNEDHYRRVWGRTTYVNLSYYNNEFSSDEFPTMDGVYSREFNNSLGLAFEVGNTYNFHKKPIGTVLFIGLDYTPLDLNFNMYDEETPSPLFVQATESPYSLPWHNKRMTFSYGMSLGPALTLYPFTSIGKSATDNIRFHFYFHVGYGVGAGLVDNVKVGHNPERKEWMWSNGLFTSFGLNLSWNFLGFGYEARTYSNLNVHYFNDDFKTGDIKVKQASNRIYIQFML